MKSNHIFVLNGPEPTPIQIFDGHVSKRPDLLTTHEEADVIIIQQVVHLAESDSSSIIVVADDTDVFVLLLHYYSKQHLTCQLILQGTIRGRTSVDIGKTVNKHGNTLSDILEAHVLSGCDTVSCLWGMGKVTVVKILTTGMQLSKLGNLGISMEEVISEATKFVAACYGSPSLTDMTALRYSVWANKMANQKLSSTPELQALPPTKEAFKEHVYRAHLQVAIWRAALDSDPPNLNPVHYGWSMDGVSNMLVPIPLPLDVSPALLELL